MTQFPAVHSERAFQLKEDTVSPGAHLPGSRLASSSKNVPFPLLETWGSASLSRQRGTRGAMSLIDTAH